MVFRFRLQHLSLESNNKPQQALCPECGEPTDKPDRLCSACQADYNADREAAESCDEGDA